MRIVKESGFACSTQKCEVIGMAVFSTTVATGSIAACGNDCSACPRYVAHPYEKTEEELQHTAELWMKIGYRDHIVTNEEISCMENLMLPAVGKNGKRGI